MVYFTTRFISSLALCFVLLFFSPFSIPITSLGEARAGLCDFVRFFLLRWLVCVSLLFLLVSGIGCNLWLWHSLDFSFYLLELSEFRLHIATNVKTTIEQTWNKRKYCQNIQSSELIYQWMSNHQRPDLVQGTELSKHGEFRLDIATYVKTITDQTWYKRKYCQNIESSDFTIVQIVFSFPLGSLGPLWYLCK